MRGNKKERILRVLLSESEELSKNELSKRSDCTRQWIILFLRGLEKKKLIKNTKVLNSKELLKYWLKIHKKSNKYREYMIKEPLKLLKKIKINNLFIVSIPQLIIDLFTEGGPCEEAGEMLLKKLK